MDVKTLTYHCKPLGGPAPDQDVSIGHLMRQLLSREVDRYTAAAPQNRAEGRLLSALRALLETDMALADSWDDLAERLAERGYTLRPAGGGLALHKQPCGARLCSASALGFAYRTLVNRFEGPMPGHLYQPSDRSGPALSEAVSATPSPRAS